MFLAAAVMTGSTCVVQCYNNKSNHRAGISLHRSPTSGPAMEKRTMFALTHSANFNPRGILITSRTVFPQGCSCRKIPEVDHAIDHSNYMEKRTGKNVICANKTKSTESYNAVEVIVCFFFNASTILQNRFSFNVF